LIFNICVFDVEVPEVRKSMIESSFNNLRKKGLFVLIVPRNISSILKRCTTKNKYLDGYYFKHHGIMTFYKNFDYVEPLIKILKEIGFIISADLTERQYICLILEK